MARHSGLQREILGLYRELLRVAGSKDAATRDMVRTRFRAQAASVGRMDFQRIEFMKAQGERQLRLLKQSGVRGGVVMTPSPPKGV